MKKMVSLAFFRKGLLACVALAGAVNLFAVSPESPLTPPKAVTYDSLIISRHPSCPGGLYSDFYNLTGINISSAGKFEKPVECLDRVSSRTTPYDLFFYNEFAFVGCDMGEEEAFPFMISNGSRVSIDFVGVGWEFFLNYTSGPVSPKLEANIDFFASTACRCDDAEKLLDYNKATNYLNTRAVLIGRRIQEGDPYTPDDQRVYILQKDGNKFLFMVKRFKNSVNPPNARYMTIVVRKLN
ncbi:MAG: hypothetical protein LBU08_00070 [Tannerellaceae bacterium]|jgi:hypothetical protein|nr:hypothetical protein [Tannerellaceae bacterium]